MSRGLMQLAHSTTVEALARSPRRSRSRCQALFSAGQLGCFMGRYAEAQAYLEESLSIAREINDTRRVAAALQPLGVVFMGLGALVPARTHLEEALALARELGNKRDLAAAINALAHLHRMEGDLDTAERLYEDMLVHARELEDRETIAVGQLNLAMVAIDRKSHERAREKLIDAIAITESIGSRRIAQSVLEVAAGLAVLREEWSRAARFYGVAEAEAAQPACTAIPPTTRSCRRSSQGAPAAAGDAAFAAAESEASALACDRRWRSARPAGGENPLDVVHDQGIEGRAVPVVLRHLDVVLERPVLAIRVLPRRVLVDPLEFPGARLRLLEFPAMRSIPEHDPIGREREPVGSLELPGDGDVLEP